MAKLLDGQHVAKLKQEVLKEKLENRRLNQLRMPGLAIILVGNDSASQIYVQKKSEVCQQLGYLTEQYRFPTDVTEVTLLSCIDSLNQREDIDGIIVQLPLPKSMSVNSILDAIDIQKDVDGFNPYHLGCLSQNRPRLRPCTPYGIMDLLAHYQIPISGSCATVVGASDIVGRPMALELLRAQATVTVCHRATQDLAKAVGLADILIVATGVLNVFDSHWIKPGAVVVDVGIHRLSKGQLRGDLEFEGASQRASWITPVPGGVGPMTVNSLLWNTYMAMLWRGY